VIFVRFSCAASPGPRSSAERQTDGNNRPPWPFRRWCASNPVSRLPLDGRSGANHNAINQAPSPAGNIPVDKEPGGALLRAPSNGNRSELKCA
jgi:hypothetical protein